MTTSVHPEPGVVIFDLDGTIFIDDRLLNGASGAIEHCRDRGWVVRFATNTTRMSRAALRAMLASMGLALSPEEILSAPAAAGATLKSRGHRRVLALLPEETWTDLHGLEPATEGVDAVLVGDCGAGFTFELLNRAFQELLAGAAFFACQRNRFWRTGGQFVLDAGAFVAALEYAAQRPAEVLGKPSPSFFAAVVHSTARGADTSRVVVVGDDVYSDILGAESCGYESVLVRTGKFRDEDLDRSGARPTWVLESVADLPRVLR